jgi:hypothetical protein
MRKTWLNFCLGTGAFLLLTSWRRLAVTFSDSIQHIQLGLSRGNIGYVMNEVLEMGIDILGTVLGAVVFGSIVFGIWYGVSGRKRKKRIRINRYDSTKPQDANVRGGKTNASDDQAELDEFIRSYWNGLMLDVSKAQNDMIDVIQKIIAENKPQEADKNKPYDHAKLDELIISYLNIFVFDERLLEKAVDFWWWKKHPQYDYGGNDYYSGLKEYGASKDSLRREIILFKIAWYVVMVTRSDIAEDIKSYIFNKLFKELRARLGPESFEMDDEIFLSRVRAYLPEPSDARGQLLVCLFVGFACKNMPCVSLHDLKSKGLSIGLDIFASLKTYLWKGNVIPIKDFTDTMLKEYLARKKAKGL